MVKVTHVQRADGPRESQCEALMGFKLLYRPCEFSGKHIEHPLHKSNVGEGTRLIELNKIMRSQLLFLIFQVQPCINKITARYWLEAISNNVSVKESIHFTLW